MTNLLKWTSKSFCGEFSDGGFYGAYMERMRMMACLFSGSMI